MWRSLFFTKSEKEKCFACSCHSFNKQISLLLLLFHNVSYEPSDNQSLIYKCSYIWIHLHCTHFKDYFFWLLLSVIKRCLSKCPRILLQIWKNHWNTWRWIKSARPTIKPHVHGSLILQLPVIRNKNLSSFPKKNTRTHSHSRKRGNWKLVQREGQTSRSAETSSHTPPCCPLMHTPCLDTETPVGVVYLQLTADIFDTLTCL